MENLNLQEMASKLNYCPICCFECECTKCVHEFDSLWKEKIEFMATEITVDSSIGNNEALGTPINRCSDNSKEKLESLTPETTVNDSCENVKKKN
jgi:hypothetical protein